MSAVGDQGRGPLAGFTVLHAEPVPVYLMGDERDGIRVHRTYRSSPAGWVWAVYSNGAQTDLGYVDTATNAVAAAQYASVKRRELEDVVLTQDQAVELFARWDADEPDLPVTVGEFAVSTATTAKGSPAFRVGEPDAAGLGLSWVKAYGSELAPMGNADFLPSKQCPECGEWFDQLNEYPKLNPPVSLCDSCEHNARRSGWEPGQ